MDKKFFLFENGTNQGPYTIDELKNKNITKSIHVWYEGLNDWTAAGDLPELKTLFTATPPPPPKLMPSPPPAPKSVQVNTNKSNALKYILYTLGAIVVFVLFIVIAISLKDRVFSTTETSSNNSSDNGLQDLQTGLANLEQDQAQKKAQQKAQAEAQALHDLTLHNRKYRNNWQNYITANVECDFKAFGGVKNGYVVVTNLTEYKLDNVTIEITYVKQNGEDYATERITGSVGANSQERLYFPDSDRGTRVKARFDEITSKQMNFSYISYGLLNGSSGGGSPRSGDDPWFYKFQ